MGTTSDKLAYLNTTKEKLKTAINYTGAGIDNSTTFRNYAQLLKDGYVDILNNGTDKLFDNMPHLTGKGNSLSLTPTYEAPIKLTCYGSTSQETTTGINLIPSNKASGTARGVTFTVQEDGTYLVNGTNDGTGNSAVYIVWDQNITLLAGTYYGIATQSGINVQSKLTYTDDTSQYVDFSRTSFTINKQVKQILVYLQVSNGTTTTFENYKLYPIISTTPITTDNYEPYTGTIPSPNPDYPQTINTTTGNQSINVCGKNLFDKDNANILNAYFDNATFTLTSNENNRVIYIACKPNTTYTITKFKSSYQRGMAYTKEVPNIGVPIYGLVNILSNTTTGTITTGDDAQYLVLRLTNTNQDSAYTIQQMLDSVQIEENSSATPYEPYNGANYTIGLGDIELCKIGDYEDTIIYSKGNINLYNPTGAYVVGNENQNIRKEITLLPNTTYTYSITASHSWATIRLYDSNNTLKRTLGNTSSSRTITFTTENDEVLGYFDFYAYTNVDITNYNFKGLQLQLGDRETKYVPYEEGWYIEKNTRRYNLKISDLEGSDVYPTFTGLNDLKIDYNGLNTGSFNSYTTYITTIANQNVGIGINSIGSSGSLILNKSHFDLTKTQWLEQYPNLEISIIYGMQVPQYDKITDTTLIEQLEALKSKYGTTNINSDMVVGIVALKEE